MRPDHSVLVRYGKGPKGLMAAEIEPAQGNHLLILISECHSKNLRNVALGQKRISQRAIELVR